MTQRSMPERTVDAWVAAEVCRAFPNARVWGPTQSLVETNWDYGVGLGDGKILILEDKATDPVARKRKLPINTHRITIDRVQLDWYCDEVEPVTGVPVYYVLPKPPWIGLPTGSAVVPDQAVCRTTSSSGRFEEWAYVIRSAVFRTYLGRRGSITTDELPIPHSETLAALLAEIRNCTAGARVRGGGGASQAAAKGAGPQGVVRDRPGRQATRADVQHSRVGSALAVFVPAVDLPGF